METKGQQKLLHSLIPADNILPVFPSTNDFFLVMNRIRGEEPFPRCNHMLRLCLVSSLSHVPFKMCKTLATGCKTYRWCLLSFSLVVLWVSIANFVVVSATTPPFPKFMSSLFSQKKRHSPVPSRRQDGHERSDKAPVKTHAVSKHYWNGFDVPGAKETMKEGRTDSEGEVPHRQSLTIQETDEEKQGVKDEDKEKEGQKKEKREKEEEKKKNEKKEMERPMTGDRDKKQKRRRRITDGGGENTKDKEERKEPKKEKEERRAVKREKREKREDDNGEKMNGARTEERGKKQRERWWWRPTAAKEGENGEDREEEKEEKHEKEEEEEAEKSEVEAEGIMVKEREKRQRRRESIVDGGENRKDKEEEKEGTKQKEERKGEKREKEKEKEDMKEKETKAEKQGREEEKEIVEKKVERAMIEKRQKKMRRESDMKGSKNRKDKEERKMARMMTKLSKLTKQEREVLRKLLDRKGSSDESSVGHQEEKSDDPSSSPWPPTPQEAPVIHSDYDSKAPGEVYPNAQIRLEKDGGEVSSVVEKKMEAEADEEGEKEKRNEDQLRDLPEAIDEDGESSASLSAFTDSHSSEGREKKFTSDPEDGSVPAPEEASEEQKRQLSSPAEKEKGPRSSQWKSTLSKWAGVLLGIAGVASIHFGLKHYKKRKGWPNGISEGSFHRQVNRFYTGKRS